MSNKLRKNIISLCFSISILLGVVAITFVLTDINEVIAIIFIMFFSVGAGVWIADTEIEKEAKKK